MPNHKVFVYGILKSPEHAAEPPDAVPGALYVIDGYAAARFDRGATRQVRGEIRGVDDRVLAAWDEIEDVRGGLYRRIRVTTAAGVEAWAYEYAGDTEGAPLVESGIWLEDEKVGSG